MEQEQGGRLLRLAPAAKDVECTFVDTGLVRAVAGRSSRLLHCCDGKEQGAPAFVDENLIVDGAADCPYCDRRHGVRPLPAALSAGLVLTGDGDLSGFAVDLAYLVSLDLDALAVSR